MSDEVKITAEDLAENPELAEAGVEVGTVGKVISEEEALAQKPVEVLADETVELATEATEEAV